MASVVDALKSDKGRKMDKPFIIDVRPVKSERVSAKEFLKLMAENPTLISRAEFVPPKAGKPGFGGFMVHYSRARHRPVTHG